MSGDKNGSKADTLIKFVLMLFISLLSFSVGTFVGKQVSDSEHRRVALEGEYKTNRQIASEGEAAPGDDAGSKISEKEVENLTEEFVNQEKSEHPSADHVEHAEAADEHKGEAKAEVKDNAQAGHSDYKEYKRGDQKAADHGAAKGETPAVAHAAPAAKAEPKAEKHAADAGHKVAAQVAEGKAPTDGQNVKERQPSSVLPSVANTAVGKYTVQVASYAEESEAKNQAAELKSKGWTAFYLPAQVNGRTWYRVTVGLFNNYKAAQEFRGQFMKEANVKTAIVQKIVQ